MSRIAYVCKCVLIKGRRYTDVDFDRECYIKIQDFESCIFYCGQELPKISDNFLVLLTALSQCLMENVIFVLAVYVD